MVKNTSQELTEPVCRKTSRSTRLKLLLTAATMLYTVLALCIPSQAWADVRCSDTIHMHQSGNHYVKKSWISGNYEVREWWSDNSGGYDGDTPDTYYGRNYCPI